MTHRQGSVRMRSASSGGGWALSPEASPQPTPHTLTAAQRGKVGKSGIKPDVTDGCTMKNAFAEALKLSVSSNLQLS